MLSLIDTHYTSKNTKETLEMLMLGNKMGKLEYAKVGSGSQIADTILD